MEIRWLRTFLAVAEELNYGRAAVRLHLAQPTVSQHVIDLERHLGVKLFERSSQGVTLTLAGAGFLDGAHQVLEDLARAEADARNAGDGKHGLLRVGFSSAFATKHATRLLREVAQRHPQIEIQVTGSQRAATTLQQVSRGMLEAGLVAGDPPHSGHVRGLRLDEQQLGVVFPRDHALALSGGPVPTAELRDLPFLLPEPGPGVTLRSEFLAACADAGFVPREVGRSGDPMQLHLLIAAGIGFATATDAATFLDEALTFRPLTPRYTVPLTLVWDQRRETTGVRAMVRAAREHSRGGVAASPSRPVVVPDDRRPAGKRSPEGNHDRTPLTMHTAQEARTPRPIGHDPHGAEPGAETADATGSPQVRYPDDNGSAASLDEVTLTRVLADNPAVIPTLRPILRIVVHTGPAMDLGAGVDGHRFMVPILGGRFVGETPGGTPVTGVVLGGGADRQLEVKTGLKHLEARYELSTDDGTVLGIVNSVISDQRDPTSPYRLSTLEVTAPEGRYASFNERKFVGTLQPLSSHLSAVLITVFVVE